MKVLWFTLSPCGSMRRHNSVRVIQGWLISLEDELKKRPNVNLSIAYFSDNNEPDFVYEGVHYYPIYFPISKNPIVRIINRKRSPQKVDASLLPAMLKVVNKSNPDLIHIHGTEERFGLIQDYIKKIPIIFSIQGLIAPYLEKYFSGMPSQEMKRHESWSDKIRNVSFMDDYKSFCYRAPRELHYLRNARYIMGRTFWDKFITKGINTNSQYFVVNEILQQPFYCKQWNKRKFSGNKLILVSTISSGIYKGFETVLRTASILKQYAAFDFEWRIAGYDSQSKWVKFASKITKLDYRHLNIKLLGRKDAEDLSDVLISSDIYCHVSHIENSPNSVCEAMLVGMPIIASYAGGTASLLEHEKEGLLVQDGDPYVLAGAIVDLQQNFNKAKAYGEAARKRATIRHDKNRIINELLNAYQDIYKENTI